MKKAKEISPGFFGRRSKTAYMVVLAILVVAAGIVVFTNYTGTARNVNAQSDGAQKKYRGTRRVIKDENTGDVRVPTETEVATMVADLSQLTQQSDSGAEIPLQNGGVAVEVGEAFGGTMLFRANPDGTSDMKCVFSLAEGLEFLGLVEDVQ